ncbi:hypothetical protein [Streptomyces sp. NPDC048639]|uniref:hypothetical protein n=1 Tax=Streptomyces sp. NPDC048639 TaxID=3365581 RepID=UPI00371CD491
MSDTSRGKDGEGIRADGAEVPVRMGVLRLRLLLRGMGCGALAGLALGALMGSFMATSGRFYAFLLLGAGVGLAVGLALGTVGGIVFALLAGPLTRKPTWAPPVGAAIGPAVLTFFWAIGTMKPAPVGFHVFFAVAGACLAPLVLRKRPDPYPFA